MSRTETVTFVVGEAPHADALQRFAVAVDGEAIVVTGSERASTMSLTEVGPGTYAAVVDGRRTVVHGVRAGDRLYLQVDGRSYRFELDSEDRRRRGGDATGGDIGAPMPGVVSRVLVAVGQRVEAGEALYGLEAMKMEHVVKSPGAGIVTAVVAEVGEQVDAGASIVVVTAEDAGDPA